MKTLTARLLSMALISGSFNLCAETATPPHPVIASGLVQRSDNPAHLSHTWTGIGRLRGPHASYCTASLIDTRDTGQPTDTSPAYILTSQRCFNSNNDGNYAYDGGVQKNVAITGSVYFNNFENTLGQTKKYDLKRIAWQSDNGLNLAIIELNETLSSLIEAGVQPLTIATGTPSAGTEIIMLGIPHTSNLYANFCTQLPHVDVLGHPWVSPHMLPNRCPAMTQGDRGAAVLNKASNELISLLVASTHGADSAEKCQALSPCDIKDNASHWRADTHYTLPVSFLTQCFTSGVFAHDSPDCKLKNQVSSSLKDPQRFPARLLERISANKVAAPEIINVELKDDVVFFRYKYSHDVNDCHSGTGYSDPLDSKQTPLRLTLDSSTGIHLLCVIGLNKINTSLHQIESKEIIALERYKATDTVTPLVTTRDVNFSTENSKFYNGNNGDYWEYPASIENTKHIAYWNHSSPFNEHYEYKYGPYAVIDCSDPKGYSAVIDMDFWIAHLLASGTVDANLYSEVDLTSAASKRIMGHLDNVRSQMNIKHYDDAIKLCTIVYNRENIPSSPHTHVFKQL